MSEKVEKGIVPESESAAFDKKVPLEGPKTHLNTHPRRDAAGPSKRGLVIVKVLLSFALYNNVQDAVAYAGPFTNRSEFIRLALSNEIARWEDKVRRAKEDLEKGDSAS